jgi:integrase
MARKRRYQSVRPKLENGQWKLRFYDLNGRRRTKCLGTRETTTAAEAKRAADDFLRPINNAAGGLVAARERSVGDVAAQWRKAIKPTRDRSATARSYEWAIDLIGKPAGGLIECPIHLINRTDIHEWLAAHRLNYRPRSLRLLKAVLSGLLEWAVEWGWLVHNPAHGRYRGLPKVERKQREIPTPEQFRRLLEFSDIEPRTMLSLAALSGLRQGEIAALRRSDVELIGDNPPRYRINVVRHWHRNEFIEGTKNRKSRTVVVGPAVWNALQSWYVVAPKSDLIFPGLKPGRPKTLDAVIQHHVRPLAEKLGLPRFSWHTLRAAYASWGRDAGVRQEVVRDQLGHSSISMTADIYTFTGDRGDVAERVESLLTEPRSRNPGPQAVQ